MSKDIKPKVRLGQSASGNRKRAVMIVLSLLGLAGGGYAAYRYTGQTKVEVPVARVRQGEFVISVKTRGEVRSSKSVVLSAPQIPDPRIVMLAESGKAIRKGETVIEFDAAQQEQYYLDRATSVRTVDKEIIQMQASHRITKEMDAMNQMTATYNVDRAKLEASKAYRKSKGKRTALMSAPPRVIWSRSTSPLRLTKRRSRLIWTASTARKTKPSATLTAPRVTCPG
jgi:HlyD family secretion protein